MGSEWQNLRSFESNVEDFDEDDEVVSIESSVILSGDLDQKGTCILEPEIVPVDVSLPPVPPRLGQHKLQPRFAIQTLEFEDDRPPVPARVPLGNLPSVPKAERRPIIEPRGKTETHLARVHGIQRPLQAKPRQGLPGLMSDEVKPFSSSRLTSRQIQTTQKTPLQSRIVLDRGRPTTIVNEGGFETENVRTSSDQPVIQLSLWPTTRSPASNLCLDAIVNSQKCSNEYVDGPTLGPSLASQTYHDLTSFVQYGSRLNGDSVSLSTIGCEEAKNFGHKASDQSTKQEGVCKDQIICPRCGRCRCLKCKEQRDLPQLRVGKHECDLESTVDCCSCMCCARALFYHCVPTEDADCSDDPCAGHGRPHCCARFAALGLLSICLPCLCFYWPMRCLLKACTLCYNGCCRTNGCHCQRQLSSGRKSLLTESESSSF